MLRSKESSKTYCNTEPHLRRLFFTKYAIVFQLICDKGLDDDRIAEGHPHIQDSLHIINVDNIDVAANEGATYYRVHMLYKLYATSVVVLHKPSLTASSHRRLIISAATSSWAFLSTSTRHCASFFMYSYIAKLKYNR